LSFYYKLVQAWTNFGILLLMGYNFWLCDLKLFFVIWDFIAHKFCCYIYLCYAIFFCMIFVRFCFVVDGFGFLFITSELYVSNHYKYGLVLCCVANRFNFVLHLVYLCFAQKLGAKGCCVFVVFAKFRFCCFQIAMGRGCNHGGVLGLIFIKKFLWVLNPNRA
jgi:hypothetical protein